MARKGLFRAGAAALTVVAAAFGGFLGATLLFAGPRRVAERAPIASARAIVGGNGRDARDPSEIPPGGWWQVLQRTCAGVLRNRLMAESAAVTFYTLLAIFPALAAIVSIYGLFADPAVVARAIDMTGDIVPADGVALLRAQLHALLSTGRQGLSLGVVFGLIAALWSANQGSKALFESLNVVYREREKRSYPVFVAIAFAFTFGAIAFALVAIAGVVALPPMLAHLGLDAATELALRWLRWPIVLAAVAVFLAALYRFGPSRANPKWRWVSWGGMMAALSWVAVSIAFSWYVQNFGNFDRTYGSLGAVIGFMMWIWLSTLVVLCGAQLNSELEHQTAGDTTTGSARPLGFRGATQADTVA